MDQLLNSPILFESTNLFFALVGLLGLYVNFKRKRLKYSPDTGESLVAWNWIYTGLTIQGIWFYLLWFFGGLERGRTFAQSFFYEYRLPALLVSATAVGWGVISFVRIIENKSQQWAVSILGILIVASIFGALLV